MAPSKTEPCDPLIGSLVAGRYRIRALLGEGGMGRVYLSVHEAIEKKVALKVLRPELSAKHDLATRFQQEAISASRIKHPNVLEVFDFGQLDNGSFFLAMELLEGHDLSQELARGQSLPPTRAVAIGLQVCRALAAAHAAGVVHRDLKPENVFLQRRPDDTEEVKLVDFGIAQLRSADDAALSQPRRRRLTRTGMIFGTPEYMAPEQAAGLAADRRVDIYSLGVLLYEMLTGAVPFTGETFLAVLAAHVNQPLRPLKHVMPSLTISSSLEAVVERMLAKRPEDRFQNALEVLSDLGATPEAKGMAAHAADAPMARGAVAAARSPATLVYRSPLPPPPCEPGAEVAVRQAESAAPQRPSRAGPRRMLGVGAGALLLVAGLAALSLRRPVAGPPAATATAPSSVLAEQPRPVPRDPPPPTPSAAPAPSGVRLAVDSEPSGAVLFQDGAQVCDQTPCSIVARPAETLELVARKGTATGRIKVLAQREQKVTIRLTAPANGPKPRSGERLCERYSEELGIKIAVKCPD